MDELMEDDRIVQEAALSWIPSAGAAHHEAFGVVSCFDQAKRKHVPRLHLANQLAEEDLQHILKECQALKENLRPALQKLAEATGIPAESFTHYTWDDLVQPLNSAREAHDNQNGLGEKFRAVAHYMDRLLEMIPDDVRPLRAVISALFQYAKVRVENSGKILDTFQDIPTILERASYGRAAFNESLELKNRAYSLYRTILEVVPQLVSLLDVHSPRRFPFLRVASSGGDRTTPNAASRQIDEIVKKVRRSAESFKICAEGIAAGTLGGIYDIVVDVQSDAANTSATVADMSITLGTVRNDVQVVTDLNDKCIDIAGDVRATHQKLEAIQNRLSSAVEAQTGVLNMFLEQFHAKRYIAQLEAALELAHSRSASPAIQADPLVNIPTLLNFMAVDPLQYTNDLDTALRSGSDFTYTAQGRARSLLSLDAFSHWTNPITGGDILLVQGLLDQYHLSRLSPMSLLVATLVMRNRALNSRMPGAAGQSFYFFCGLQNGHDDLRGPTGLMRSLILQLVHYLFTMRNALDLSFINTPEFREGLRQLDYECLRRTMENLFLQLAAVTQRSLAPPYVMIDGIHFCETDEHAEAMCEVVATLAGLSCPRGTLNPPEFQPQPTRPSPYRGGFKLLLTVPHHSTVISRILEDNQSVFLRSGYGDPGPMTERNMGVGGPYHPPHAGCGQSYG